MANKILLTSTMILSITIQILGQAFSESNLHFQNPTTTSNDVLCATRFGTNFILGGEAGTLFKPNNLEPLSILKLPTNYDLIDIEFVDEKTGFALVRGNYLYSNNNSLFKTTDEGITWSDMNLEDNWLTNIVAIDENSVLVFGSDARMKKTTNSGSDWIDGDLDSIDKDLTSSILYNNEIYVIGHQRGVYKSSNYGETWQDISIPQLTFSLLNISPSYEQNKLLISGESGQVYIFDTIEDTYSAIHTLQYRYEIIQTDLIGSEVFALGRENGSTADESILLKFNNADSTWKLIKEYQMLLNGFCDYDDDELIIFGKNNLLVIVNKTTGEFRQFTENEVKSNLIDASFIKNKQGWALSEVGDVLYTSDAGNNWSQIYQFEFIQYSNSDAFLNIDFIDSQNGWITQQSNHDLKFYRTTDTGFHWEEITVPRFGQYKAMEFITVDTGFIARDPKYILKTTNGGDTWTNHGILTFEYSSGQEINTLQFINSKIGFGVGGYIRGLDPWGGYQYEGLVIKTTDAGESWNILLDTYSDPIPSPGSYFTSICFVDENIGFVTNGYELTKTTDGGETWIAVDMNYPGINYIYFQDENIGWGAGWLGGIYTTKNGGINWVKLTNITNKQFNGIESVNDTLFYLYGAAGTILRHGDIPVSINTDIPDKFEVFQNYPNPFNGTTNISFSLHKPEKAKITVYTILGAQIEVIADEYFPAGFNVVNFNSRNLASGIYIYEVVANGKAKIHKMVLMK